MLPTDADAQVQQAEYLVKVPANDVICVEHLLEERMGVGPIDGNLVHQRKSDTKGAGDKLFNCGQIFGLL